MEYNQENKNLSQVKQQIPSQFTQKYDSRILKEYVRKFNSAPIYQYQPCIENKKKQPEMRRSSSFSSFFGLSDHQSSTECSQQNLRKSQSQSSRSSIQKSIQSSQNSSLCHRKSYNYQKMPMYQYKRKIPKKDSNIITYIITIFSIIFLLSFIIDMKFQMQHQTLVKEKQIQRCFIDYQDNKCDQPVQVLIQQCNKLAICASKDPKSEVRMTVILSKTLGTLFSTFFNHIGTLGLILLIALMLVCFFKPNSYQQQHHVYKYS